MKKRNLAGKVIVQENVWECLEEIEKILRVQGLVVKTNFFVFLINIDDLKITTALIDA